MILILFMMLASLAYAVAFSDQSTWGILRIIGWTVFVGFLIIGSLIATVGWYAARAHTHRANLFASLCTPLAPTHSLYA